MADFTEKSAARFSSPLIASLGIRLKFRRRSPAGCGGSPAPAELASAGNQACPEGRSAIRMVRPLSRSPKREAGSLAAIRIKSAARPGANFPGLAGHSPGTELKPLGGLGLAAQGQKEEK